jgi:hypothetical protein
MGTLTLSGDGALAVAGGGSAQVADVSLAGGTLADAAGGDFVVGRSAALAEAGRIVVAEGATIAGYGTVGGAPTGGIIDNGTIAASGGQMALGAPVSGTGIVTIAAGAILIAALPLGVREVVFGPGGAAELSVGPGANVTSKLSGFASGDTIDLRGLLVASVKYYDGTLTLENACGAAIGSLRFLGDDKTTDFTLTSDNAGGTVIGFAAAAATSLSAAMLQDFLPSHSTSIAQLEVAAAQAARQVAWVSSDAVLGFGESLSMMHHPLYR